MIKLRFSIFLLLMVGFAGLTRAQPDQEKLSTLAAGKLKPIGRYAYNDKHDLELISSAVHFGFSFKGSECAVYTYLPNPKEHNFLQYTLDGVYQKRIRINGGNAQPIVIKTAQPGLHRIWIYKATEAQTGPIFVSKIEAAHVKALPIPKSPLIEFIGNSITCGAAADPSEYPCGTGTYHDQHNAYMAYGPRLARALDVNFIVSSVSGIGIYRNWNSDGPTMPQVYEKTGLWEPDQRAWDFKTNKPVIVSIALGTNDFSNGDGKTPRKPFDAEAFTNTYVKFVELVKSKYPNARIALLSSPMVKGQNATTLEQCLLAVKHQIDSAYPNDKSVETFFFKPMEGQGCGGHPSVEQHGIMAEEALPFFKKLLSDAG